MGFAVAIVASRAPGRWVARKHHAMNTSAVILIAILEAVALVFIVRLWVRCSHRIVVRIVWSLILLVPLFGLLMFGLVGSEPKKHSLKRFDSSADSDAFYGGDGGL
jgi:O-antigen/teichoic acid export membrane protein